MLVQAKKGTKCPKEGKPREYITTPAEVPETAYYRRLLADGSLEKAPDNPKNKSKTKKGGQKS